MTSIQVMEVDLLTATLEGITEVANLVDWNGQKKIFWEHVPQDVPLPYVVLVQMTGGEDNSAQSRSSDSCWKVTLHTGDMGIAKTAANAIRKLAGVLPTIPAAYTNVCVGYTTIEEESPIFDRIQVQNVPIFMVGGTYRIRLSIGE